ncbi:MAG: SAM-dependent methyltransferase [Terriglobia bacterium]|nr:MAG: SAM-dependent methyltransferase [Terriglobia bacterium]
MTPAQTYNEDQRTFWNGINGEYWARNQDRMDRILAPMNGPLLDFAAPAAGSAVVDVGCGCGATTVALASRVGPAGRVTGIDISEPMLGRARERLREHSNTTFLLGDAADLSLKNLGAELIVSRFGVMFFGDPVAAFSNLRTALVPGGRIHFACWRPIPENPWLQVPLHAAYEHVPRLPKPGPEEPGPFSFADPERVTRILIAAGFGMPTFRPLDIELDIAAGGTLEDAAIHAVEIGPTRRALAEQPEEIQALALESIRRALAPYAAPDGVKLSGAVWLVGAGRAD